MITHKTFYQICTWLDDFDKKKCLEFLDGLNNDEPYFSLFELYKQGQQQKMFDAIKKHNETRTTNAKNDAPTIRDDARMPRRPQNRNIEKLWKRF